MPCAPGGAPVPRVTRLTGVVDGKPAVIDRAVPSGRREVGEGRRVRRGDPELVPAEPVEEEHGDPVDAGQGGAEAQGVALVGHPEDAEHAGHHLGEAALPVRGAT